MNFPLLPGTEFPAWQDALRAALARIKPFRAGALIVSLGVDTFGGSHQFLSAPVRGLFHLRADDLRLHAAYAFRSRKRLRHRRYRHQRGECADWMRGDNALTRYQVTICLG